MWPLGLAGLLIPPPPQTSEGKSQGDALPYRLSAGQNFVPFWASLSSSPKVASEGFQV